MVHYATLHNAHAHQPWQARHGTQGEGKKKQRAYWLVCWVVYWVVV